MLLLCVCYLLCMHVLLKCTAPGPVSFISVESVNSSSLNISWGAASPANGDITHYLVWVNSSSQHYQSNITAPDMGVIEGRLGQWTIPGGVSCEVQEDAYSIELDPTPSAKWE